MFAHFAGANAHGRLHRDDKNFSVTNLAGLRGRYDEFLYLGCGFIGDDEFDFHLGQKIQGVFAAAVDFRAALLAAESLDLGDGHAFDAGLRQRGFYGVQSEGFDDRLDFFHWQPDVG